MDKFENLIVPQNISKKFLGYTVVFVVSVFFFCRGHCNKETALVNWFTQDALPNDENNDKIKKYFND